MSTLRVAFVVQGEGRGHMTQALALAGFLTDAGHAVEPVLVGVSPHRPLPDYFERRLGAAVSTFAAPTQVPGRARRGVSALATGWDAARRLPRFVAGGREIARLTRDADLVVNFLDLVGGLSRVVFRSRTPGIAVAHNHLFTHSALPGGPGSGAGRAALRLYGDLTALRCRVRVALSFDELSGSAPSDPVVAPPLLRAGLESLHISDEGYLLAYALNPGYGDRIAAWQRDRRDVTVHCYLEGGRGALTDEPAEGFHAHDLDDTAFLAHLAGCRGYVGSAGFESLSEAHYLGKPVLAVPTDGQLEQQLNAWDAERAGVARTGGYDGLDDFWDRAEPPKAEAVARFREWVGRAPALFVRLVEESARAERARSGTAS